jgi:Flp pilus assembly protein TadG
MKRHSLRNERGSIAELPVVLWVLFSLLVFPLLDLAAIGLRTAQVSMAAQRACAMASRANSFHEQLNGNRSAMEVAQAEADNLAKNYGGVRITKVKTSILVTKVDTHQVTVHDDALAQPANTADNIYQIKVAVSAEADPLITIPYLPVSVAGMTEPLKITFSDQQYAECPQGLNI